MRKKATLRTGTKAHIDPRQVQLNIIFNLLITLVENSAGESRKNKQSASWYRKQWKLAEAAQNKPVP